jgi:hypothetical protein
MKTLFVIMLVLGTVAAAGAAFDLTGWSWQRSIPVQATSGFVRLSVPPEVFDQSEAGLNDLRVLDDSNKLVPHVIHWGRVRVVRHLEWLKARLLNATYLPGEYTRITAEFGDMDEKNQVTLGLSGVNYRRRALLEGSNHGKAWEVVAEDLWLFDVSLPGQNFKVDTLKFPRNNFRFLRVTVYNMPDDPRRISIQSVKAAFQRIESEKELVPVPVKNIERSYDKKHNHSVFELDLGLRNLPLVSLECKITTPYFYRGYELLGRNQSRKTVQRKTESGWQRVEQKVHWKSLRRGVLYQTRYKDKTSKLLRVEGINAPYRYLQLRVFNGDNPPLQLDGVRIFRRDTSLVFEAHGGQTYTLIGGNPKARAADFDLARAVRGVDRLTLPVLHPGPAVFLAPEEKMVPWSERHGFVILGVLIVAVAVMFILIVKNLKKLPTKPSD